MTQATTTEARIYDRGEGFPDNGETVYCAADETLYVVLSAGCIHTDNPRGNYVIAQLDSSTDDVSDLTDAQFAELREVTVEISNKPRKS